MSRQATTLAVTSSRLWSLSIQVGYSGDASSLRSLESTGCPRAPDFIVFYDARPSIESFECTATYQCSATRCQCSRGVGFRPFLTTSRTHPGDTGRAPTDLGPIQVTPVVRPPISDPSTHAGPCRQASCMPPLRWRSS